MLLLLVMTLVTFNGTGALDPNATTTDTAGPALTLDADKVI